VFSAFVMVLTLLPGNAQVAVDQAVTGTPLF
jgi:hypothetical protein